MCLGGREAWRGGLSGWSERRPAGRLIRNKNPPRGADFCGETYLRPRRMRSAFSARRASRMMALLRRSRLEIGLEKRI